MVYNYIYMVKGKFDTKKITVLAVLTALSLLAFLIENLFPPFFVPGAKLGVANIFSLIALIAFTPTDAIVVVVCRTVLGAIFQGNVSALLYSFTGGVASILACALLVKFLYPKVSVVAISVFSAVCHNVVQTLIYWATTGTALALSYLPYLVALAVPSGILIGVAVIITIKTLPLSLFEKGLASENKDEATESVN